MAVAWLLKDPGITSVLVGVRNGEQLDDNLKALSNKTFTGDELKVIENVLKS